MTVACGGSLRQNHVGMCCGAEVPFPNTGGGYIAAPNIIVFVILSSTLFSLAFSTVIPLRCNTNCQPHIHSLPIVNGFNGLSDVLFFMC